MPPSQGGLCPIVGPELGRHVDKLERIQKTIDNFAQPFYILCNQLFCRSK
ncbi:hypothetical protein J2Z69_003024 [Paenibacillus shirakamiensis]|uniref:Uncharacterized protein n=1 Tax=Paenibacillus shirakamiensis TaxID=1265935 RepID=A0ABS4JJT2_9BACL|nr:hypothetical protein [Paenibacillus shirakamiensis]